MEKSDPTGALEDFQHAIELEPESADIFYHRGQVHFLMGNLEDAAKDYEKSISLNSTIAFAYIQLGVAMYRIGNHKDAIVRSFLVLFLFFFLKKRWGVVLFYLSLQSQFKKAEQKFPESHDVFNYFGEILLDQSQFDEALQKFERGIFVEKEKKEKYILLTCELVAMTLAPKNPLAYINKGLLLFQYNKDTQAAMDHIKQAIAVDDRCDIAYAHMAQLLLTQKHIKGAIENYEHGKWEKLSSFFFFLSFFLLMYPIQPSNLLAPRSRWPMSSACARPPVPISPQPSILAFPLWSKISKSKAQRNSVKFRV